MLLNDEKGGTMFFPGRSQTYRMYQERTLCLH